MSESTAAMNVAMRVLNAVRNHAIPEAADVEELRRLAQLLATAPADELACDVIQQALKRRQLERERARRNTA
jgi:hypothetical protein